MKKIFLALLLVLALVSVSEGQRKLGGVQRGGPSGAGDPLRTPTGGGSVPVAGVVYTDCSNIGTAQLYWNGEHTSGNTYGCKNSTTTINGTLTNAEIVDSDSDPGTASPSSGNNVVKANANDERLTFTITSGDIFTSSEGMWCADVYAAATTESNNLFRAVVDANNVVLLWIQTNNTLLLQHIHGGTLVQHATTGTISDTAWTNVCARWSTTNNQIGVKIGAGSWTTACPSGCTETDSDSVGAFASEPSNVRVAGGNVQTNAVYIDNIYLYTTSGL